MPAFTFRPVAHSQLVQAKTQAYLFTKVVSDLLGKEKPLTGREAHNLYALMLGHESWDALLRYAKSYTIPKSKLDTLTPFSLNYDEWPTERWLELIPEYNDDGPGLFRAACLNQMVIKGSYPVDLDRAGALPSNERSDYFQQISNLVEEYYTLEDNLVFSGDPSIALEIYSYFSERKVWLSSNPSIKKLLHLDQCSGEDSLPTCEICGMSFTNTAKDVEEHYQYHLEFLEKSRVLGHRPLQHKARESSKKQAYQNLSSDSFDQALEGAKQLITAHYDRSLNKAIRCGYSDAHPSLTQYFSMIDDYKSLIPDIVMTAIRSEYGHITPSPLKGSYWYP